MKVDEELIMKIFEMLERFGIDTGNSLKIESLITQFEFENESDEIIANEIIKAKRKIEKK
jgi:hypothetical protein